MMQKANLDKRPCARMIIRSEKGKALEDNFKLKYPKFNTYAVYTPINFELKHFKHLLQVLKGSKQREIDGFRVYLGKHSGDIVFVFNAMKNKVDVEDAYYALLPDKNFHLLTKQVANDIVIKYQNDVYEYTNTIVDNNTKSYLFGNNLIVDFLEELCFHTDKSPVKGLIIKLGAHVNIGAHVNNDDNLERSTSDYKDQIMIGFAFTDIYGKEIGLEKLIDGTFGCQIHDNAAIGADTGTPCPPNSGCGIASLGH